MGVCNTPLQSGTYGPSKNCLVFIPFGAVGWGVFNTPLQSDTCDPSKYRCHFLTGYLWPFKKLFCFHLLRGRGVGHIRYAPTIGYVRSFEISMQIPNRVRVPFRNTDAISQPDTCDSSKYRCDLLTGGTGVFGRWGGGGYRLRGRWA